MTDSSEAILRLSDCTVDLARHRLIRGDETTSLTTREAELLAYLSAREGRDVERDDLLTEVWGYRSSNPTRAVDFTIRRLRAKVEPDPANPVHIISVRGVGYRYVGTGEPVSAPTPKAPTRPSTPQHSIPAARTRFIGRALEIDRLSQLVKEQRLITLLGMGGAGKTALALHWAREHLSEFPGGVWFCDLSPTRETAGVLDAVAAGIGHEVDARATREQAIDRLASTLDSRGHTLVVLDNAEQVDLGPLVESWLDRTVEARFLITSRERLNVRGEAELFIAPLDAEDGAELFIERARAIRGPDAVTDEDADAVRAIVDGLDGLPLAIEIAASRVATMSPTQLADRLESRFRLITAPPGSRPERHSSLRSALDWSWDLLGPWEQRALAVASVFRGGFTLEAAEEVLAPDDDQAPWTIDLLGSLRDKSLVLADAPSGARDNRYRLLESVRAYAQERLQDEDHEAIRNRHAEYYIREGENLAEAIEGPAAAEMFDRLALERSNLAAAWRHAPDPVQRIRAALALRTVLLSRGPLDGYRELLDELVGMAGQAPADLRARVYIARARFFQEHRPREAEEDLQNAIAAADEAGAPSLRAMALHTMASLRATQGRLDDAEASYREALELHTKSRERSAMARDAIGLAYVLSRKGAEDEAEKTYQRALAVFRRNGDRWGVGLALANLFGLVDARGRFEAADTYAREAISILTEVGDRKNCARVLCQLGVRLYWRGDAEEAESHLRQALALQQQIGDRRWEGVVLTDLAEVLVGNDRLAEAEALLIDAMAIAQESDDPQQEAQVLRALGLLRILEQADWEADAHLEDSLALLRERESSTCLPGTLHALALLRVEQGRFEEALSLLGEADGEAARLGQSRMRALLSGVRVAALVLNGRLEAAEAELQRSATLVGPYAPSLPGLGSISEAWVTWGRASADGDSIDAVHALSDAIRSNEPTVQVLQRALAKQITPEEPLGWG